MCASRHGFVFVSISTTLTGASKASPWSHLHSQEADVDDLAMSISLLDSLLGEMTLHGLFSIFHVGCLFFTIEL